MGALVLSGIALLSYAGIASAAAALVVSPDTGLTNGQSVTVSGSGFADSAAGAVLECNNDPGQPTVEVAGVEQAPVGCTDPLTTIVSTDASGNVPSTPFTVVTGTIGPPAAGTDSAGNDAATDAALYPCPPTPAQITAGDSCVIAFGTLGGSEVQAPITFEGQGGGTTTTTAAPTTTTIAPTTTTTGGGGTTTTTTSHPTTTTTTIAPTTTTTSGGGSTTTTTSHPTTTTTEPPTTTTTSGGGSTTTTTSGGSTTTTTSGGATTTSSSTTSTTAPTTGANSTGSGTSSSTTTPTTAKPTTTASTTPATALAFTGAGPGLKVMAIGGLILINLGFLVMTLYYSPMEMVRLSRRRIARVFGARP